MMYICEEQFEVSVHMSLLTLGTHARESYSSHVVVLSFIKYSQRRLTFSP